MDASRAEAFAPALRAGEATSSPAFSPEKASFGVKVKGEVIQYRVFGVFVMPGEALLVEAAAPGRPQRLIAETGEVRRVAPARWNWSAPRRQGLYRLRVIDAATDETITLNVFVMTPFDHRSAALNGYRIGQYQPKPLRGNPVYRRPPGFVEVTAENRDARVSPHFTLGQFLCKQDGGYPRYLALRERLVLKLEMILEEVNKLGVAAPTLHVMSAFRTPYYNASIGNRTVYSRHLYGDAADIFVDTDGDGRMDDLDGDGRVTTEDARVLAALVDEQTGEAWYRPFLGGMGIYGPASHRGPFVHVDVRGQRVRW